MLMEDDEATGNDESGATTSSSAHKYLDKSDYERELSSILSRSTTDKKRASFQAGMESASGVRTTVGNVWNG